MQNSESHPFQTAEAKEQFLAAYDARAQQWPIPSETTLINTSYGKTFVRISGLANNPPLILLHGHSENSLNWLPNIEDLSQAYRTYAIDIISDPGCSVYSKIMKNADDFVNWLDEVVTGLNLNAGINLVGLSYGGWLACQYSLKFQQRLNKLVLIAPAGISSFPIKFIVFALFLSLFQFRIKFLFKRLTRWMFVDFLKSGENETAFNEWFEFIYLGMKSHKSQPIVFAKLLTDEQLRSLNLPILFLSGENEIVYSVKKATRRLQSLAPNVETQIVKNAGHDLPIARPKEVNQAILNFLDN